MSGGGAKAQETPKHYILEDGGVGPCVESGLEDWRAELPALLEGQNQLSLALPAGLLRFSRGVLRRTHGGSLWDRSFGPPGSSTWSRSCSEIFISGIKKK